MEDLELQVHSFKEKKMGFIIHLWDYEIQEILEKHLGDNKQLRRMK